LGAATSPNVVRDGAKAVQLAKKVLEHAGHADVIVLRTLAAGYAESGRFPEAIETAQQALQLAIVQDNSALIWDLQLNIANYQRNRPLRDPGASNKTSSESGITTDGKFQRMVKWRLEAGAASPSSNPTLNSTSDNCPTLHPSPRFYNREFHAV
jgi:hypothetical protein